MWRWTVIGHEKREIGGRRSRIVFKRKFKTLDDAEAVAKEVARRISDIYTFGYAEILDAEDGNGLYDHYVGPYDTSADPNLEDFDVKEFLKNIRKKEK